MLPLFVLLLWGTAAKAQYDPARPPEPGVNFTLTARCMPSDGGYNIYGGGTHAFGSNVNMRVSTTAGYRFIGWEDEEGTVVSTSPEFTYVMPAKDVSLIARFEYDPSRPSEPSTPEFKDVSYISFLMNPSDAGSLYYTSAGEYEVGSTQRFTVRENTNYRFVNWTCEGIELGTSSTLEYTVPKGDRVLVANFAYDPTRPGEPATPIFPNTLTLLTDPDGAASLSGGGSYIVGSNVSVSEKTNAYYNFVNWTDEDGNVVSESSRFTYTMPDRNVTLTANYTYDYNPSRPGEPGTPNPGGSIAENMVLWPRMGMYDDTHVQILCETPGATIHYTLDGSTPNAESPVYTEPVFVGSNLVVKAIAYKEGMEDSPVVSYQVTVYKTATPVFTFENMKLNITSATPGAIIRYTTDFTDPTEESEVFKTPFLPEENCRIKAYASKEGLTDSPINIFVFRRADYTIPAPTFSIDDDGKLVIIPSVSGGQLHYTLDGSDPDADSPIYTEPLALDGNFTVKAYTTHVNFYDSPVGEYVIEGYKVAPPAFEYVDLALAISVETPGASIRYTTDGSVPTEESPLYSEPLSLAEDCKVVAVGFKANYEPSDTVSYMFVYADHKVAAPVIIYDAEALRITMTCATPDAQIRYTTDGSVPTDTTGTVYTGPIDVVGNMTFTARGFLENHIDSDITVYSINDLKLPTPTASYGRHALTLACEDVTAEIRYTADGNPPTSSSTLYVEPIPMTDDCTVRFIAMKSGYNDSDEGSFRFVLAEWQEAVPSVVKDYRARRIIVENPDGAAIRVSIDGEERICAARDSIDVDSGMHRFEAVSVASGDDRYDSEGAVEELVFHLPPALDYDGHSVYYGPADGDPEPAYAEASLFMDDVYRHGGTGKGSMDVTYMARLTAVMSSDHAFRSDSIAKDIDFFNTGRKASARNGHRLSECFGTWGDSPEDYTYLCIGGEVEKEDLELLGSLPNLTALHLEPYRTTTEECDSVLAGSRIETLFAVNIPQGMLKGMPRLTTVLWGITNERMPEGRLSEAGNPNILLWVTDEDMAPVDAVNVVTYPYVGGDAPTDPDGEGVTGTARHISLRAGYPFGAHMPVEADSIELTKEFSLPTVIGECAGWETVVLPFDAESILHEQAGEIVPFRLWNGPEDEARPFWLYNATADGWTESDSLRAGIPYIISMPNNEEYVHGYSLPGKVTFAGGGTTLGTVRSTPKAEEWLDGIEFVGTFMPVEEKGIRSLNVNVSAGRDRLGSAFVTEDETLPFGAYLRGEGMPRQIPVFGDWSGVLTPSADASGIVVETPAVGTIRVSSHGACSLAIVTPEGTVVRTLSLRAGESKTAEGLPRGLYIVAGRKVMVR